MLRRLGLHHPLTAQHTCFSTVDAAETQDTEERNDDAAFLACSRHHTDRYSRISTLSLILSLNLSDVLNVLGDPTNLYFNLSSFPLPSLVILGHQLVVPSRVTGFGGG